MKKPLKVSKFLKTGALSPLLAHARQLATTDQQVIALLPAPLQPHCHVLSLQDGVLVLAADSPVWASRLRFHAPKLVKQLSGSKTVTVRTVRVRVNPPEKSATSAVRRHPSKRQGPQRISALQEAAETVSDARLKSALLRLSRR